MVFYNAKIWFRNTEAPKHGKKRFFCCSLFGSLVWILGIACETLKQRGITEKKNNLSHWSNMIGILCPKNGLVQFDLIVHGHRKKTATMQGNGIKRCRPQKIYPQFLKSQKKIWFDLTYFFFEKILCYIWIFSHSFSSYTNNLFKECHWLSFPLLLCCKMKERKFKRHMQLFCSQTYYSIM